MKKCKKKIVFVIYICYYKVKTAYVILWYTRKYTFLYTFCTQKFIHQFISKKDQGYTPWSPFAFMAI